MIKLKGLLVLFFILRFKVIINKFQSILIYTAKLIDMQIYL